MKKIYDNELKALYDISIPPELSQVVQQGMQRAEQDKRNQRRLKRVLQWGTGVAAAIVLFTASVNLSPAFAETLSDIPVLGRLVQILQFQQGEAEGGQTTDGTDISDMEIYSSDGVEQIVFRFNQGTNAQDRTGAFHVDYRENPYTMTFSIGGARQFSAKDKMEEIKVNPYVDDVYMIITMDDSLIRFVIQFNQAVEFTVEERAQPAAIVLQLQPIENAVEKTVYSIRTHSYPFGETVGILEEMLMPLGNVRMMKDIEGYHMVEVGLYETMDAANQALVDMMANTEIPLLIETRVGNQLPASNIDDADVVGMDHDTDDELSVHESEPTVYEVSVIIDGQQTYGTVQILERGLRLQDETGELLYLPYADMLCRQLKGEASFILQIEQGDQTIQISGVYQSFFDQLAQYTDIES